MIRTEIALVTLCVALAALSGFCVDQSHDRKSHDSGMPALRAATVPRARKKMHGLTEHLLSGNAEKAISYFYSPEIETRTALTANDLERLGTKRTIALSRGSIETKRLVEAIRSTEVVSASESRGDLRFGMAVFDSHGTVLFRAYVAVRPLGQVGADVVELRRGLADWLRNEASGGRYHPRTH